MNFGNSGNSGGEKRSMSLNHRNSISSNNESQNTNKFDILIQSQTLQTDNLRVVIRIRPPLPREIEEDLPFRSIVKSFIYEISIGYCIK